LMMLRDQGKVHLDDEIKAYAPNFWLKNPFPSTRGITFRQLGCHMAGQPGEFQCDGDCNVNNSVAYEKIHSMSYILPSDTRAVYSNLGFALLGNILAQEIESSTFDAWLKANILAPLKMTSTGVNATNAPKSQTATAYVDNGQPCLNCLNDFGWSDPCCSMYSSGRDLAKLITLLLNYDSPKNLQEGQVLDGSSIREMMQPRYLQSDRESGFALPFELYHLNDYMLRTKLGDVNGYSAQIVLVPELKLGIAVLANKMKDALPYAEAMSGILIPGLDSVMRSFDVPAIPQDWKRYVGVYTHGSDAIEITGSSNALNLVGSGMNNNLKWYSDNLFQLLPPLGDLESCFWRSNIFYPNYQWVEFQENNGRIISFTIPAVRGSTLYIRSD